MSNSLKPSLEALGFQLVGSYRAGAFRIAPQLASQEAVYAWSHGRGVDKVLRVGVACGQSGLRGRYALYNRWLAGRFKPYDATEQKKRALFLKRLDDTCLVWARPVSGKAKALMVERALRDFFGVQMDLDLMVKGSWAKQELARWRSGLSASQA